MFVTDAEGLIRLQPLSSADYPYEQIAFQTREVVCERFHTGTSPTWERQRRESLVARPAGSLITRPDVVDAERRAEVLADRAAFLRRRAGR